jgi:hypothetical protein
MSKDTYEIGYRRPPKGGQFKKGQSGNPSGRPKGSKNFMTLLDQELDQKITVNENGRKKEISRMQAVVKRMVAESLQGNLRALMAMVEIMRRHGKFDETDAEEMLPGDYSAILDSFMAKREKTASKKSTRKNSEE